MNTPQRRVRHLHVRAAEADAARALLPRLDDALRCASLPDAGARLLLVRRLDLGRVPPGCSATELMRRLEQRVAASGATWIDGTHDAAAQADHVSFPSALDARLALAQRLLRHQPCDAWYWPAAVPEWQHQPPGPALQAMRQTLQSWPEAPAALAAWDEALQAASALAPIDAPADEAGAVPGPIRQRPLPNASPHAAPHISAAAPDHRISPQRHADPAAASPLAATTSGTSPDLAEHPLPPTTTAKAGTSATAPDQPDAAPASITKPPMTADTRHPHDPIGPADHHAAIVPRRIHLDDTGSPATDMAIDPAALSSVSHPRPIQAVTARAVPLSASQPPPSSTAALPQAAGARWLADAAPHGRFSTAAGLLFLLPVLERLGLPQRSDDPFTLGREVLRGALQRLRVAPDDPAWALTCRHPALPPEPDAALSAAATGWLTQARHWLRRDAGLGLASLVRRPGGIACTPTHIDLHFRLADTDLRVRRLGLDVDPGWLAWFGRVVQFHFHRHLQLEPGS